MKQLSLFSQPEHSQQESPKWPTPGAASVTWKLYVDGAARNNPGPAGAGVCIIKNDITMVMRGFYLGKKTNNQAEYLALIIGLLLLGERIKPGDQVTIISDSLLLVQQLQGNYRVKHPELKPLFAGAQQLLTDMHYQVTHVLREHNTHADEMANYGIDKKVLVPAEMATTLQKYGIVI